ncbi:MAG: hypothetical protein M3530_06605 [Thermoproteota archaeon]|nr:hypothetical protein [Thermoproteota archaeon]
MTRSIVENIPFRAIHGFSIDSGLALDLESNGIKQFVDLSVRTQHLKVDLSNEHALTLLGKMKDRLKQMRDYTMSVYA